MQRGFEMSETVVLTRRAQLLALAVQMAGYVPTESLAVVTIRSKQVGPVAVVKLPTTADLTWTVAETLTGMLQRHADAAVLVVFTDRPQAWAQPVQQLAEQLDRAAEISAVLYADGDSYGSYGDDRESGTWSLDDLPDGVRLTGLRVAPSRDTLRAALDPSSGGRVIAQHQFSEAAVELTGRDDVAQRGATLLDQAFTLAQHGKPLDDDQAADLIVALAADAMARFTAVVAAVSAAANPLPPPAAQYARSQLVGATPDELIEGTGTVLAYAAYVGGNGTLANLAIDRIAQTNRSAPTIAVLDALIQQATPPAEVKAFIDDAAQRLFGPPTP
jgi:hypothetical protein